MLVIADQVGELCQRLGIEYMVKASFEKVNRNSGHAYRGPGAEKGVAIRQEVRKRFALPLLTDIHESHQAAMAAQVVAELAEVRPRAKQRADLAPGGLYDDEEGKVVMHFDERDGLAYAHVAAGRHHGGPAERWPRRRQRATSSSSRHPPLTGGSEQKTCWPRAAAAGAGHGLRADRHSRW